MPRYKITVEYDGTNLLGWQRQLDGPSAQEHLENALFAFTHQASEVCAAGRTDAGVHALAQVAHFDTPGEWDLYRLREAFNANLRNAEAPVVVCGSNRPPMISRPVFGNRSRLCLSDSQPPGSFGY